MTTEVLLVFAFMGVGLIVAFWALRPREASSGSADESAACEALRGELESLRAQYNGLLEKHAGDQRELEMQRQSVQRLEASERAARGELTQALSENKGLSERLSAASARAEQSEAKLTAAERTIEEFRKKLNVADQERSALSTTVKLKEESIRELDGKLMRTDAQLKEAFENVSRKVMAENAEKFSEKSRIDLENILKPFKETLELTKGELQQSKGAAKEHEDALKKQVAKIVEEADALTRVFRGRDLKAFGDLGEELLERVLNAAGLARGTHYEVQAKKQDDEDRSFKPDVIVKLPDEKHLIIDSKAVLKNYNAAVTAEDKKAQREFLEANVSDIRDRVKELHDKHYPKLKSVRSPDFVLMYVPFEQAFLAALEQCPMLVEESMRMKVAIVTNSTLLATLRTVSYVWSLHNQQRNAENIAKQGGRMLDKFINFVDDLQKVGNAIDSCHSSFDEAWKKLSTGNGNLVSQAKKLHSMGVEGKKKPQHTLFHECVEEDCLDEESSERESPVELGRV